MNRTIKITELTRGYTTEFSHEDEGAPVQESRAHTTPTELLVYIDTALDLAIFDPMHDPDKGACRRNQRVDDLKDPANSYEDRLNTAKQIATLALENLSATELDHFVEKFLDSPYSCLDVEDSARLA